MPLNNNIHEIEEHTRLLIKPNFNENQKVQLQKMENEIYICEQNIHNYMLNTCFKKISNL
jgi:hypothetical protein